MSQYTTEIAADTLYSFTSIVATGRGVADDVLVAEARTPRAVRRVAGRCTAAGNPIVADGVAMEVQANNHFGRVRHTEMHPECHGNWRCFQAAQVLDILFQKLLDLCDFLSHGVQEWRFRL